jgi:spermidine synthase
VDVPVIGLIGRNHRPAYSHEWIETHAASEVRDALTRLSLADSIRFFGNFAASRDDLVRFAGGAQINTDDHPRVTFMAPRHNYESASVPSRSLFALLQAANPDVSQALGLNDPAFASRIVAYRRARDVYLGGLATYSAGKRDKAIEAYIASARLSPDFTAGYAQCLSIAAVLAKSDPPRARDLLEKLVQAQPDRPVAREMLLRLTAP